MEVTTIVTGAFATNTYLIDTAGGMIVVDPGGKADKLLEVIKDRPVTVLLTHGHFDHIKAVDGLYNRYQCPIYMHQADRELTDPLLSKKTNVLGPYSASISSPVNDLKEGSLMIYDHMISVYFTPGHTKGSVVYQLEDVIFSGDTLFKESVGRTDLYGGNERDLRHSLALFESFSPDTIVYPGHGEQTTIGHELIYNPFLR